MSSFIDQNKSGSAPLWLYFSVMVLLSGLLSACEDEVNPFIGTELPFTVWGTISPVADTQAVRVFSIDDVLKLISPDPLDATVSIINIDDNNRYVLQDSVIQLQNGDFRHIYWAEFDVDYFETYRLEVERSDGQLTNSAEIQVPGPISLNVLPANTNAFTELIQPLWIGGNPPAIPRIDVTYNSFSVNTVGVKIADNPVTVSYSARQKVVQDTLRLDLDIRQDFLLVREDFNNKEIPGSICIENVTLDVHIGNKEWQSPTGVFDPNFLVEPGTFTNIENGFGFFGAGFVERLTVDPPGILLVRAGFFDCGSLG